MKPISSDNGLYPTEAQRLQSFFNTHREVAVAFSGGVDSAVLLLLASKYAKRTKAYYVKSQFQPPFERNDAIQVAKMLHTEMEIISVDILSSARIVANPGNRCYYCKKEIFGEIIEHAQKDGFCVIVDGTNASDDVGDRPGFQALQELRVLSPLRMCGYTKAHIRQIAEENHLPVADKPSYACLATRIPTDTVITGALLETTQKAEDALKEMGFQNVRIRYRNGDAVIELGRKDFTLFYDVKDAVYAALSAYYHHIYLDLKERADE